MGSPSIFPVESHQPTGKIASTSVLTSSSQENATTIPSLVREPSRDRSVDNAHINTSTAHVMNGNTHASGDLPATTEEKSTTSATFNKEKLHSQAQAASTAQFVSEKDKSFTKLLYHLSETKKEVETLQKQRKEWSLESQRLREKCQQLEDRISTETSRCAGLEDRLEKSKAVQRSMQTQLDQQAIKIENLTATIEHQQFIIQSLSTKSTSIMGSLDATQCSSQSLVKSSSAPPSHGSSPSVTMKSTISTVPTFDGLPPATTTNITPLSAILATHSAIVLPQDAQWNPSLQQPAISNSLPKPIPPPLHRTNSQIATSTMTAHQGMQTPMPPVNGIAQSTGAASAASYLSGDSAHIPPYPAPSYFPQPANVLLPTHPQSELPSLSTQPPTNIVTNPVSAISSSIATAASSGNQSPSQKLQVISSGTETQPASNTTFINGNTSHI